MLVLKAPSFQGRTIRPSDSFDQSHFIFHRHIFSWSKNERFCIFDPFRWKEKQTNKQTSKQTNKQTANTQKRFMR